MVGPGEVMIAGMVLGSGVAIVWGLARVYLRKLEIQNRTGGVLPNAEMAQRLERIEQAVDAIAIEMERVSEGQRFTTKLLAERVAPPAAAPRDVG